MQQFDRDLMLLLHDVARLMRTRFDQRARAGHDPCPMGDPGPRARRQPGLSQNEMASLLEVEPITVGRLVDRLEARGLVERRPDPTDRRIRRLHLLPAAPSRCSTRYRERATCSAPNSSTASIQTPRDAAGRCAVAHEEQSDGRAGADWRWENNDGCHANRYRFALCRTQMYFQRAPGLVARLRADRTLLRRVLMIGGVAVVASPRWPSG